MRHLFFWTTEADGVRAPSARRRRLDWGEVLVVLALATLLSALIALARQWTGGLRPGLALDLTPWALPYYALLSLGRVLLAYLLSLGFALGFAYWASRDAVAGRVFYPLVDHAKRAIPVLGLLPLLAVALLAVIPQSNIGLELAAVLTVCASQFWPLTSSFRHSLRRVPQEWQEMATAYHFSTWQRFQYVELPFALTDLVWNSVLAVARGWFVLMAAEALMLGHQDFRLPGIGSFLAEAVDRGRFDAALWALAALASMIVALDQLLWRPALAWVERFRPDDAGPPEAASSWFLQRLRHSGLLQRAADLVRRRSPRPGETVWKRDRAPSAERHVWPAAWLSRVLVVVLLVPLSWGAWELVWVLRVVSPADWGELAGAALVTLGRVLLATALATLWTVPVGLALGLSRRWSPVLQPVAQVLASFPSPVVFPLVVAGLQGAGVSLGWGSVLLMLLAAQWYLLFNVAAGAAAVPADLREMVHSFRFTLWHRCRYLYLPATSPQLVAGWDAATGAAWNASMVAEVLTFRGVPLHTWGLGAEISAATQRGDFSRLAACLVVLVVVVGLFNQEVLGRLYRLAEQRYVFNR